MKARRLIRDVHIVSHQAVFGMGLVAGIAALFLLSLAVALSMREIFALLIGGGLIAFAYASVFRSAHRSGAVVGLNLGLYHCLIAGILSGFTLAGFFCLARGFMAMALFIIAHLLYGAIVGALFDWAATRNQYPHSLTVR